MTASTPGGRRAFPSEACRSFPAKKVRVVVVFETSFVAGSRWKRTRYALSETAVAGRPRSMTEHDDRSMSADDEQVRLGEGMDCWVQTRQRSCPIFSPDLKIRSRKARRTAERTLMGVRSCDECVAAADTQVRRGFGRVI